MIPAEVIRELKQKKKTRVLLQLPEGLKTKANIIASELQQNGFEPIVSGDPCFGACDLKTLKGATTLHVGHNEFIKQENIVYWNYEFDQGLIPAYEKAKGLLTGKVGLFTTVQHLGKIGEVAEQLGDRVANKNYQVLGCRVPDVEADSFLYIGGGRFHPLAIAYHTKKTVVAVDPFSLEVQELDSGPWEKERALRQTKAMNAGSYGIVVSSKPGQKNWNLAKTVKSKLEKAGKKVSVIYLDNCTPDSLLPYGVDAFVITACPRIVLDDWKNYKKPVLLPDEIMI